jgi:hypothetical protein
MFSAFFALIAAVLLVLAAVPIVAAVTGPAAAHSSHGA